MDIFLLILRLVLTGVFATSAVAKLADRDGSEKAMRDFGMPASIARVLSLLLSLGELVIAGALLFVSTSWFAALAAAALLVLFIAMMMYQYAKGNAPDCHCFGQLHSEPVGLTSIIRNIFLLIPAGILSVQGQSAQGYSLVNSPQDALIVAVGATLGGLLLLSVVYLKTIAQGQADLARRVDILEVSGGIAQPQERKDIGHPREGLPLGALVPEFSLPDLEGNTVSLSELKEDGLAVLFLFVSPSCGPCRAMLPELERWEKIFAGNAQFVYVSNGTVEANRKKLNADDGKTILIQNKREIADIFRAKWTPMAVLMNNRGRIVSFTAAGDAGITRLLEEMKFGNLLHPYARFQGSDYQTLTKVRIGEGVPEVEATDINGAKFSSRDRDGKQTLLTFWSSTCPHCVEMMDQIREWEASKNGSDPEMVLFVSAKEEEVKALGLKSRVILDEELELGDKLGQFASPSAVLIDENGHYISETVAGSEDIWALIGKRF